MEPELRLKLGKLLSRGIETEESVVYLLVEIRKLADRTGYPDPALRMFCNWIAHIDLAHRSDSVTDVLKEFDDELEHALTCGEPFRIPTLFSLDNLRERLRVFLERFGLPLELVSEEHRWRQFQILYAGVVIECPIIYTASKKPLKHILALELRPTFRLTVNDKQVPVLKWRITFRDGKKQTVSMWGGRRVAIIWPSKAPSLST